MKGDVVMKSIEAIEKLHALSNRLHAVSIQLNAPESITSELERVNRLKGQLTIGAFRSAEGEPLRFLVETEAMLVSTIIALERTTQKR